VTERVAPRAPLRVPIALLIVLALVAAGLVALAVASRRDVPNPFGPAGNGEVLYVVDGTIYTLDPTDMGSHPFLADGSGSDHGPVFSLDGAHVAFARSTNDGDTVYVAAANGTGARPVPEPLVGLTSFAWSPDGRSLAVAARGHGYPQVFPVAMDGSGSTARPASSSATRIWPATPCRTPASGRGATCRGCVTPTASTAGSIA
jgi:hypothetical protein